MNLKDLFGMRSERSKKGGATYLGLFNPLNIFINFGLLNFRPPSTDRLFMRSKKYKTILFTLALLGTTACDQAAFVSNGSTTPTKKKSEDAKIFPPAQKLPRPSVEYGEGVIPDTTSEPELTVPLTDGNGLSKEEYSNQCWFAVSGNWIAHPSYLAQYADQFVKIIKESQVEHGKVFDNVGGIFLAASDTPYEFGVGEKLIDSAVNNTFDSILVAPGMHVLIKNADGVVLFDGPGPVISGSATYENRSDFRGLYYKALKTIANDLPQWMANYLNEHTEVKSLPLWDARYVKISTVYGSQCGDYSVE